VGVAEITYSPKKIGELKNYTIVGDTASLMYCDSITPQFVGSGLEGVLRTFTTPTVTGKYNFDPLFYLPVEKRTFQDIRIEVMNLKGAWIQFRPSDVPVQVVLHFRRVTKR
jgi:hypothetical protein